MRVLWEKMYDVHPNCGLDFVSKITDKISSGILTPFFLLFLPRASAQLCRGAVAEANLFGPASVTLALLHSLGTPPRAPGGHAAPSGVIVNVASSAHLRAPGQLPDLAGRQGLWPTGPTADELDASLDQYAASKFGLLLFSRALRTQIRTSSCGPGAIVVRDCHPGLVWTDLLKGSLFAGSRRIFARKTARDDRGGKQCGNRGGLSLGATLARPFFFSPVRGAAVVLETALREFSGGAGVPGTTDEELRSYVLPSGRAAAAAGLIAAGGGAGGDGRLDAAAEEVAALVRAWAPDICASSNTT